MKKKSDHVSLSKRVEVIRKYINDSYHLTTSQRSNFNAELNNAAKITDNGIRHLRLNSIYSDIQDIEYKVVFGREPEDVHKDIVMYGYVREKKKAVDSPLENPKEKKEKKPAFVIEEPEFE